MIDLSDLNYNQLIELEKEIQKEKIKKAGDCLTKGNLTCLTNGKVKEILAILDPKFQDTKYGYPNNEWRNSKPDVEFFETLSPEMQNQFQTSWERPEVTKSLLDKLTSSMLYLCDIALENYEDYIPKFKSNRSDHKRDEAKSPYYTVRINKEIPWTKADRYESMYNELCDVFLKYIEKEEGETE